MADRGLRGITGYRRFWWAASVSEFGTYVTALAIQVLIVVTLHGTAADVGLVNAARFVPYLVFGLVAGVFIDRVRRRPVLVAADLIRGLVLALIPILALTGGLSIAVLAGFMIIFGTLSLAGDAASQAFLPRLVPTPLLTRAHAGVDQSSAVAQASGPALAGGLIALVGAPWAVVVDALSYLFSGFMLLSVRVDEPVPPRTERRPVRAEVAEGLRWVYRHPTLAPMALTTHAWFVFSGVAGAVLVPFVLQTVLLGPFALGLALSLAGVGALAGSVAAPRLGIRLGIGRTVVAAHALTAVAYAVLALAPTQWAGFAVIGLGQFILGVSMGASNSNEMGYRQTVTPDRLQGRMNTTIRSINRSMIVIAAPLGGLLADRIGYRPTIWIVAAGMAAVSLALGLSRFRCARIDDPVLPA